MSMPRSATAAAIGPGVRADWLMADELFPVCSPALLQGNKPLRCPQDLAHHTLLHSSGGYDDDWRLWLTAAGLPTDISKQPGLTFDLIFMTVQAAIDGIRRRDGPDLLCRGRHRQGPAGGPVQDRAAGRCRLLSGFAQARADPPKLAGVPAMAERLGAEQALAEQPPRLAARIIPGDSQFDKRFPVGRAAPAWQIVRIKKQMPAGEKHFRTGRFAHGGELAMSQTSTSQPPQIKSRIGAILRATSGNFLEQFDFFLFGFYAQDIAKAFFPAQNDTAALLNAYGVFWLGALMRPVGAIVLGSYIDRIGRRQGLIVTLALMALGTVVIAFCPTYAAIGVAAPIIVLIGRLIQGFSAGVELGGVSVYLSEIATPGNRGFYTSFQSSSQQVAIFVAAIIGFILRETIPGDTFWAAIGGVAKWRIPFFIGCMIIPVIFVLRRSLEETPAFLAMKKHPTASRSVCFGDRELAHRACSA